MAIFFRGLDDRELATWSDAMTRSGDVLDLSRIARARIAPADKRMYALRDVTGTIESLPMIAASIMSKKLAEGIDGVVIDCKVGRGAFLKTAERARALCALLRAIAERAGKRIACVL